MDLKHRCRLPELMDDPGLNADLHHAALRGLRRINLVSRGTDMLWSKLRHVARKPRTRPLRVLDVACGGGDFVVGITKRAAKSRVPLEIDGCDISPRAVEYASKLAAREGIGHRSFFVADAIRDQLPDDYDVVMCSLFLHHLDEEDATQLLKQMASACRHRVLVSDLRRTRIGYTLAVVGCRLLTRSPVVHTDGPLSVRAAWSDAEVRSLAAAAGMQEAQLTHHWPQRFLLTWSKR